QKPARTTSASPGAGPANSHAASCGAASTNATAGSQAHDRNSAIAVVPVRIAATNANVSVVAGAPTSGGATRAAMSPKAATSRESKRMAVAAAARAPTNAPA